MITLLFVLVGCNGGGGAGDMGGPTEDVMPTKSLYSAWVAKDQSKMFNLSQHSLGTITSISMLFANGAICDFNLGILGTETNVFGSITFSTHRVATGPGDPGCAALNGNYRATIVEDTMTLCESPAMNNCVEYE